MDILTLELFDVTVSQALVELNRVLKSHPEMPIRVYLDGGETTLHNVLRYLERQGRTANTTAQGSHWQLDIAASKAPVPPPPAQSRNPQIPAPVPQSTAPTPRATPQPTAGSQTPSSPQAKPLLLLRSAFSPGDRALGRRLLLGVLRHIDPNTPWIVLAHEALELLQDPMALDELAQLSDAGTPVKLSKESLAYLRLSPVPSNIHFEIMEDATWQAMLARGEITVIG